MSPCYLSSSCFSMMPMEDVLSQCRQRGIMHLEWSAPHPWMGAPAIAGLLRDSLPHGFAFVPHNYFPPPKRDFVLNIASENEAVKDDCRRLMTDVLEISAAVNAPLYGVHAGYLADPVAGADGMFRFPEETIPYGRAMKNSIAFVEEILPSFRAAGVRLLIENLFPVPQGEFSLNCSFEEIKDLMAGLGNDVGLLLDLGHLNVTCELRGIRRNRMIDAYLSEFGSRIFEVHLSENNGRADEHKPVLPGSWQLEIIKEIQGIPVAESGERIFCLRPGAAGILKKYN